MHMYICIYNAPSAQVSPSLQGRLDLGLLLRLWVNRNMYIYKHTCTHTYIYVWIYTYIYICI